MKIGFHLPISKGFNWTLTEAKRLECDVIQIFVKNPRSWEEKKWRDEDIVQFKKLAQEMHVFAHLSYLPNIAKIDEDEKHIKGFMHEVELCKQIGIDSIVVHCGSRTDKKIGLKKAAESVNRVLDKYGHMHILLENASGQGNSIGKDTSELATIFKNVKNKNNVFLCLDTAHLFQSGYDIRIKKTWDLILKDIIGCFGENKVALFHINDSKTFLGSTIDRHWHIGKGEIGLSAFKIIVNNKSFAHLCGIMETPKMGKMDEENMRIIRSLFSPLVPRSLS